VGFLYTNHDRIRIRIETRTIITTRPKVFAFCGPQKVRDTLHIALYHICASANFSWLTSSARVKENYRTGQGSLFVGVTNNKVQYLHGGGQPQGF
jgi:hypothetical protein